jgi:hypothetical protein
MRARLRRLACAGIGALVLLVLVIPVAAQASTSKVDSLTSNHIARALAKAPRGVTHWSIEIRQMEATGLTGSLGREGAGLLTNTVYGNCGSAWMAIGNQGGGHAWIALGWDINYAAYAEAWATAVTPAGSRAGSGAVAPWSSHSWDTGYSAFEGYWVVTFGAAWMAAYLYPFQGPSACTSNGPTASAFITP